MSPIGFRSKYCSQGMGFEIVKLCRIPTGAKQENFLDPRMSTVEGLDVFAFCYGFLYMQFILDINFITFVFFQFFSQFFILDLLI